VPPTQTQTLHVDDTEQTLRALATATPRTLCSHRQAVQHGLVIRRVEREVIRCRLGERGEVTLYFEPFILSLECRTLDDAELMTRVAQEAGFRESGCVSPAPLCGHSCL